MLPTHLKGFLEELRPAHPLPVGARHRLQAGQPPRTRTRAQVAELWRPGLLQLRVPVRSRRSLCRAWPTVLAPLLSGSGQAGRLAGPRPAATATCSLIRGTRTSSCSLRAISTGCHPRRRELRSPGARTLQASSPCDSERSTLPAGGREALLHPCRRRRVPWLLRPLALALLESVSAVRVTFAAAGALLLEVRPSWGRSLVLACTTRWRQRPCRQADTTKHRMPGCGCPAGAAQAVPLPVPHQPQAPGAARGEGGAG